jgi:prepilin-type N-terminal cleavage/methylation domain-containing protein
MEEEAQMQLATGPAPQPVKAGPRAAFTLVELIVVMSLMVIAVSVAAPSLRFFLKGRSQEDEARRFLELARYGSSRAVEEGLPVDLWINVKQNTYGMAACRGYTESKTNSVTFQADADVTMQVSQPPGMLTQSNFWTPFNTRRGAAVILRFQPDGFISDTSPQIVKFTQGDNSEIWVTENSNHMRYDLELNHRRTGRF